MRDATPPYHGEVIVLGTMHAKDRAIAKPFKQRLTADICVPADFDTDRFGTFTGETPRTGTMADAARAKALAAMIATSRPYAIGSEGSFGPHPEAPFVPSATELLVFVDRRRGIEVHESVRTLRTNFNSVECCPGENIAVFLKAVRFPQHGLVVAPSEDAGTGFLSKGLTDVILLADVVAQASSISANGKVRISADMRANFNPTRMAVIRRLARRLSARLASLCPACRTPGFGEPDVERGLPCAWCGEPTAVPIARIQRCVACTYSLRTPFADITAADPGQCQNCNP